MTLIPLKSGKFAIVDERDFGSLSKYNWLENIPGHGYTSYAVCSSNSGGKKITLSMHRMIMGATNCEEVDHINGNGLDNRRCNLRLCTRKQNAHNVRRRSDNSSGYKGVQFHPSSGLWMARIFPNKGNGYSIGYFRSKEEAAKAYDREAIRLWGEFARTNFPRDSYPTEELLSRKRYCARLNKTSRYIGVSWDNERHMWQAAFRMNNKRYSLGRFSGERDAALARDAKAIEIMGAKARLNFPAQEAAEAVKRARRGELE